MILRKTPAEIMLFFKDINISGNTRMAGALTANQGVIIPTGASLSTDGIINVVGNDIQVRTTGTNSTIFLSNDVEKVRIKDSGMILSDAFEAPQFRTNLINTTIDTDFTIQRNGVSYLQMTSSPNTIVSLAGLRCDNGLSVPVGQLLSVNSIVNPLNNDVIVDATLTNNIVFRANATEQMRINSNGVQFNNFISLPVGNTINLGDSSIAEINAGYRIFQIVNPDPTGTFRIYIGDPASFGNQVFWMNNTLIVCRKPLQAGSLESNYINTGFDTDMVFARSAIEYVRLQDVGYPLLNFMPTSSQSGISAEYLYANVFANRSYGDTVFVGSNVAGDARVEYCRYDRSAEKLLYATIIDNAGRNVIGNIIDTTISDEKLKTDIEEYNEECSECVKNVKLHKFNYKNEKYKDNDKYGMVAQELLKHLPNEMKGIVREVKDRDSEDTFLTINYVKLSLVLWKSLQEEMKRTTEMKNQIEDLESSVYELQEAVKELKGKGKAKAKAKAKAKVNNN